MGWQPFDVGIQQLYGPHKRLKVFASLLQVSGVGIDDPLAVRPALELPFWPFVPAADNVTAEP